eukprot:6189671-Prymnesium_polylepis.1
MAVDRHVRVARDHRIHRLLSVRARPPHPLTPHRAPTSRTQQRPPAVNLNGTGAWTLSHAGWSSTASIRCSATCHVSRRPEPVSDSIP